MLCAATLAFDQCVTDQPAATYAVGVADCNGTAIDIEPIIRNAELVATVNDLHGEGFVQLPQVDVFDFQAGALEQFRHGEHRTDTHFVRLTASHRKSAKHAYGCKTFAGRQLVAHDELCRGTVGELTGVARRNNAAFKSWFDIGYAFVVGARANAFIS